MGFALLEIVVLGHDLPEHGLRAGDLGAVVQVYGREGLEVEFVRPSGQTKALVTLRASDVRAIAQTDLLAVRTA
jgi:hypothetical protein